MGGSYQRSLYSKQTLTLFRFWFYFCFLFSVSVENVVGTLVALVSRWLLIRLPFSQYSFFQATSMGILSSSFFLYFFLGCLKIYLSLLIYVYTCVHVYVCMYVYLCVCITCVQCAQWAEENTGSPGAAVKSIVLSPHISAENLQKGRK